MFRLKRFLVLTLIPLPLLSAQVQAVEHSPSAEVQKNISVLKETKSCLNCDLSGANLNRLDLSEANLAGANLSRSSMALTDLSGANLQNTDLREAVFTGADLADTDMRGADLTGTSFAGAYMIGALMDGEMLSTKPYAKDNISDIEESIYVEDTVKSKTPQMTDELTIGNRRDFEETPPVVPTENISKKSLQSPPATVLVEDTSIVEEEVIIIESFPNESAVAPAAKAAPAMNQVRIREEVVPVKLPIIEEIKKEKSSEVLPETIDEQEVLSGENKIDEAFEKDSVVITRTQDPSVEVNESKIESSEYSEIAANNTSPVEELESNMELQETPVSSELTVAGDPEDLKTENPQTISEEITAVEVTEEVTAKSNDEPSGVLEKVLTMFSAAEPSSEVMKNASILLDTNRCYGCNLQGVNLSGENLGEADLEGADLSNAILKDVDFEEANLKGANLSGTDLTGADLSEADLYRADLSGANLTDASLEKALLDDANLTGVKGYHESTILLLETNN